MTFFDPEPIPPRSAASPAGEPGWRNFLADYRRWWLVPLVLCAITLVVTVVCFLSSSIPFIYTIF